MNLTNVTAFIAAGVGAAGLAWLMIRVWSGQARKRAVRLHEKEIRDLVSAGRFEDAATMLAADSRLDEALELLIQAQAWVHAGKVAMKKRDFRKAAHLFQKGGDAEAAVNALVRMQDFRSAAEVLSAAGEHERSAEFYKKAGNLDLAAEEFVAAGRFKYAADIYAGIGDQGRARMYFALALRKDGKLIEAAQAFASAGMHIEAAECLLEGGRPVEAALEYQRGGRPETGARLLEKHGNVTEAAAMYVEAGDHEAAARLYQVVRNPTMEMDALVSGRKLLEAGHMAYRAGNRKKAEDILKMATPGDRGYDRICMLLGRILEEDGRIKEALSYYAAYAERAVATPATQQALNYLYDLFTREKRQQATLSVLRALERGGLMTAEQRNQKALIEREQSQMRHRREESREIPVGDDHLHRELPEGIPTRYRIVEKLGAGGTAVVYRARDEKLQRDVVLKILQNSSLPPDLAKEYFLREAQIVAAISHPAIVKVFDMGVATGRHYMILEYVDGVTLEEYLAGRPDRRMPVDQVARMSLELAEALSYAHSQKIIHRDVKPTNIMINREGAIKLMDFGMAKALEIHRDQSQYICGTPDYMSPEQEAGYDLTSATDVYSFALVIAECLLGPLPAGNSAPSTRQLRHEFISRSALPARIRDILLSALDPDPDRRPDVVTLAGAFKTA